MGVGVFSRRILSKGYCDAASFSIMFTIQHLDKASFNNYHADFSNLDKSVV